MSSSTESSSDNITVQKGKIKDIDQKIQEKEEAQAEINAKEEAQVKEEIKSAAKRPAKKKTVDSPVSKKVEKSTPVETPVETIKEEKEPLGQILIKKKAVDQDNLNQALEIQKNHPEKKIGEILESSGFVTQYDIATAVVAVLRIDGGELERILQA